HRWRTDPAARRRVDRRAARRGIRNRNRDQRHQPGSLRCRLDLREPQGGRHAGPAERQRTQVGFPPTRRDAGTVRATRLRSLAAATDGRTRGGAQHPCGSRVLSRESALGTVGADAQDARDPLMQGYSDRVNHAFTYLAKHYLPRIQRSASLPSLALPANVAIILVRHGAEETTVVASILHHLLEIAAPSERAEVAHRIGERFGPVVLGVASDAAS